MVQAILKTLTLEEFLQLLETSAADVRYDREYAIPIAITNKQISYPNSATPIFQTSTDQDAESGAIITPYSLYKYLSNNKPSFSFVAIGAFSKFVKIAYFKAE